MSFLKELSHRIQFQFLLVLGLCVIGTISGAPSIKQVRSFTVVYIVCSVNIQDGSGYQVLLLYW